ncbi:acetamidase [Halobacteriales archaeon QS_9_67_17]|nr:MAG: acetamidase [Halobacteriales archaeon QS_9_67_17]
MVTLAESVPPCSPEHYTHHLSREPAHVHYDWDRDRDPVLSVESGDTVTVECHDAADGQLPADATVADVEAVDAPGHPMTGPIYVEGAEPGDTLAVDVLDLEHEGIGWTYVYPSETEAGFLPAEFPDGAVHTWDLDDDVAHFRQGIEVPLAPFPGNLGVVPAEPGPHSTIPPRSVGGNLHSPPLPRTCPRPLRLGPRPRPSPVRRIGRHGDGPFTAVAGLGDDVNEASREAVRAMVAELASERDLSRTEAYMLCSAAVDLKVSEVVNDTVVVTAYAAV